MVGMIRILARVAPGNVHLAGGQIDDHCGNGALTVQGIDAGDVVIADRVRQVDMILWIACMVLIVWVEFCLSKRFARK